MHIILQTAYLLVNKQFVLYCSILATIFWWTSLLFSIKIKEFPWSFLHTVLPRFFILHLSFFFFYLVKMYRFPQLISWLFWSKNCNVKQITQKNDTTTYLAATGMYMKHRNTEYMNHEWRESVHFCLLKKMEYSTVYSILLCIHNAYHYAARQTWEEYVCTFASQLASPHCNNCVLWKIEMVH